MPKNPTLPDLSKLQPLYGANYRRRSEELLFFQELGVVYVLLERYEVSTETNKFVSSLSTPPPSTSLSSVLEKGKQVDSALESYEDGSLHSRKPKPKGSFEVHNRTCRAIVSNIQAKGIPMDELLTAYVLIDYLPSSWSDYRSKRKHDKKKISLDALIADILIEDANKKYVGNNQVSRSLPNNANVVEGSAGAFPKF
ncbi:hypothetical protein V2J09_016136 [Rumex salicifolius]